MKTVIALTADIGIGSENIAKCHRTKCFVCAHPQLTFDNFDEMHKRLSAVVAKVEQLLGGNLATAGDWNHRITV